MKEKKLTAAQKAKRKMDLMNYVNTVRKKLEAVKALSDDEKKMVIERMESVASEIIEKWDGEDYA